MFFYTVKTLDKHGYISGQTLSFLALVAAVTAAATREELWENIYRPTVDTDPNTLSCDPTGQQVLLLPHFEECNKYYMCDNGKEVEFVCPAELYFDFLVQTCNWQWATPCYLREPKEEEGSGSGEVELIESHHEEVHFNNVLDCNSAGTASKMVAYKHDCQRYWKCTGGVPMSFYCSDGLFFNESSQQCDFEGNVKCAVETDDELKGEYIVYQ